MSILGLYDHMWWDAPEYDDEPDLPVQPAETLTVTAGLVCWSAAPVLDDDD